VRKTLSDLMEGTRVIIGQKREKRQAWSKAQHYEQKLYAVQPDHKRSSGVELNLLRENALRERQAVEAIDGAL